MKKTLFSVISFALTLTLIFSLTSCQQKENDDYSDERFQKGVEYGMEDMFLRIYNSTKFENEKLLFYGDIWDTEHFSLTMFDTITKDEAYIGYDLTLKTTTVGNCAKSEEFFFNIYAFSDSEGLILKNDDFLWDSALYYEGSTDEYLQGNNVKGKCKLLDNSEIQTLIIIIATKGHLYSATYYI